MSVQVSIFNGSMYWDGAGFTSATEMFFAAATANDFADWSYDFSTAGTYTVSALITDDAGNQATVTESVTVA